MYSKFKQYSKKKKALIVGVPVLVIIAIVFVTRDTGSVAEETESLRTVVVESAASLSQQSSFSVIGSVESRNQADIQAEASGRVTGVQATLGSQVSAGQILFQLENASERAAVLQAEGSYEAALAAAEQSDIGRDDAQVALTAAQNGAVATYRDAYNTINSTVLNTLDVFFTDPQASTPGVRIDSLGNTAFLNSSRTQLNTNLNTWLNTSRTLNTASNLESELSEVINTVDLVVEMLDVLTAATAEAKPSETLNGSAVTSYTASVTSARAQAVATIASLQSAVTGLQSAKENLNRATVAGTNPTVSSANAQVKQALGSLRSAQANLAKTIVRTPISGTLNEFSIKTGDFVSNGQRVALVANNDALEITTFVGESDRARLVTEQAVLIEGSTPGTVTAIAPAIDTDTRKFEVKIATESTEITNGDTVSITVIDAEKPQEDLGPVLLPITAIKFTDTDGKVFTVEEKVLVSHDVTLGNVRGSFVEVTNGVTADMEIVVDARGLSAGQQVEPISK